MSLMKLSPQDISALKNICRQIYGRDFSDAEIEEMGTNLINLYKLILNINRDDY